MMDTTLAPELYEHIKLAATVIGGLLLIAALAWASNVGMRG